MFGLFSGSRAAGKDTAAPLRRVIRDGALLVDVRTPGEFALGHVNGSINIPLNLLASQLDRMHLSRHIVVFCQSGNRSRQAKRVLDQHGFTNVYDGGTWRKVMELAEPDHMQPLPSES